MTDFSNAPSAPADHGSDFRRRRIGIMAVFVMHATVVGTLYPRIPDIQTGMGLSAGQLGLMLVGQPTGAIVSMLFSSWLIERFGPKPIIAVSLPLIALAALGLSLAPGMEVGFATMVLFGFSFAATNMSMNVEADRVEALTGKRLMNRCHGIWSIGVLVTSTLSAGLRGLQIPVSTHFLGLFVVLAVFSLIAVRFLRASPPRTHDGAATRKRILTLPTRNTLILSGIILAGVVPDSAVRAWSIIFMRDSFHAPAWVDSMTLPVFVLLLASGRLFGDTLVTRFGASRTAAGLILVALAGLTLVLFGPGLEIVFAGFALMGLGISVLFPLVMSAGARLGDRPASENVTAISLVNSLINLGTPALIGFLADSFGIRAAFGVLAPVLIVALFLTPRLSAGERK